MISPAGAALLRTTLAFTMSKGSEGTNVIPQEAWVVGNMRFSHHQGKKSSIDAITALAKKYDVEIPIIEQVNEVLFNGKSAESAVKELMIRDKKIEIFDDSWDE